MTGFCPACGHRRYFGPALVIVEGIISYWYVNCRRCGAIVLWPEWNGVSTP